MKRAFYKKKRWLIPFALLGLFLLMVTTAGNSPPATPAVPASPPRAITAREWQLIAKDPATHAGESVVVYGEVTQFDAATGPSDLRASVDGVDHPLTDGFAVFPTNTILTGDQAALANVVQNDVFVANVTVLGAKSYDTQVGGNTTVPSLQIQTIKVTGHGS